MDAKPTGMVTSCGRQVLIGRFRIPTTTAMQRVVLRIDPEAGSVDTVWASLTPDEAMILARALIAQAQAVRGIAS